MAKRFGAVLSPGSLILVSAVFLGTFIRLYHLAALPPGLNSDEAAAGVEALSILRTSTDRWGYALPVYFVAWGTGMNVLYSYLSVPVIAVLGLDAFSIRLPGALFGCLTIPLAFLAGREHAGRGAGLVAAVLIAFMPWHVMASRWALEGQSSALLAHAGPVHHRKGPVRRRSQTPRFQVPRFQVLHFQAVARPGLPSLGGGRLCLCRVGLPPCGVRPADRLDLPASVRPQCRLVDP